mmetsp:Transcript_10320/g.9972  ORF Transcript_10320/g.9972 Transcript_10320/m.9972 type:complete len:99 (+) Transcript_10320:232-528(+)
MPNTINVDTASLASTDSTAVDSNDNYDHVHTRTPLPYQMLDGSLPINQPHNGKYPLRRVQSNYECRAPRIERNNRYPPPPPQQQQIISKVVSFFSSSP